MTQGPDNSGISNGKAPVESRSQITIGEAQIAPKTDYDKYLDAMDSLKKSYDAFSVFVEKYPVKSGRYYDGYFFVESEDVDLLVGNSEVIPFSGTVRYNSESMDIFFEDYEGDLMRYPRVIVNWGNNIQLNGAYLTLNLVDGEIVLNQYQNRAVRRVIPKGIEIPSPYAVDQMNDYHAAENRYSQEVRRRKSIMGKLVAAVSTLIGKPKKELIAPEKPVTEFIDTSLPELTDMVTTATKVLNIAYQRVQNRIENIENGKSDLNICIGENLGRV